MIARPFLTDCLWLQTALGVLYLKMPMPNPDGLPGIRMKFTPNWARSPHQLLLTHIEREYQDLPDQPCLFQFLTPDRLAIQFPSPRVVEDEAGNPKMAPPVRAVTMGGDAHMERVVLDRVVAVDDGGAVAEAAAKEGREL